MAATVLRCNSDVSDYWSRRNITKFNMTEYSPEQCNELYRLYLKEMMWCRTGISSHMKSKECNTFFESIPDSVLDISSEARKRLLLKYLCSNIEYLTDMKVTPNFIDEVVLIIDEIAETKYRGYEMLSFRDHR